MDQFFDLNWIEHSLDFLVAIGHGLDIMNVLQIYRVHKRISFRGDIYDCGESMNFDKYLCKNLRYPG